MQEYDQRGQAHELQHDSGPCVQYSGLVPFHGEGDLRDHGEESHCCAPCHTSRYHGEDEIQKYVGGGLAGIIGFQTAYKAVHAQLQAHCHRVGIHEGHAEHQTPQHRGGHTHGHTPWSAAHHAADHNGEVHEAQHLIHLWIMGGQQRQQKAAGQTDRCKGELLVV